MSITSPEIFKERGELQPEEMEAIEAMEKAMEKINECKSLFKTEKIQRELGIRNEDLEIKRGYYDEDDELSRVYERLISAIRDKKEEFSTELEKLTEEADRAWPRH